MTNGAVLLAPDWELYGQTKVNKFGKYNAAALSDYRWVLEE